MVFVLIISKIYYLTLILQITQSKPSQLRVNRLPPPDASGPLQQPINALFPVVDQILTSKVQQDLILVEFQLICELELLYFFNKFKRAVVPHDEIIRVPHVCPRELVQIQRHFLSNEEVKRRLWRFQLQRPR